MKLPWLLSGLLMFSLVQAVPQKSRVPVDHPCLLAAAEHYGIDRRILQGVLKAEGGWPGLRQRNSNGTYDMGPMQINSIWLPRLQQMGLSESLVVNDVCTNIGVGSWILARELKRSGASPNTSAYWQAVGRYHSATPHHNVAYALRVWRHAKLIQTGQSPARQPKLSMN
jgi:hypothetical protein